MKITLTVLLMLLAACGPDVQPADQASEPNPADLILMGGKVVTVDPEMAQAEAIAINGHTITAVGSNDEIATYIGPNTEVMELDGRLAIPGFIEGHGHYMGLGRAKQILDLGSVDNWGEIVGMVARAVDGVAPGDWVFGRGWHQEKWDTVPEPNVDGVPLNDQLNAIAPDNPVYLGHASGHASFANDAALDAAGIGGDTPDPDGGTIVRAADGKATGLLRENAQDLVEAAIRDYQARLTDVESEQVAREQVRLAGEEALRFGVTSFQDAGSSFATIDFLKKLEDEGALPIRLYVMVRTESNAAMAEQLPRYRMVAEGNDFLTVRSIKRQIDGALGAHGAWLFEPYTDLPSSLGLVLEPVADIERTAELAVTHGFQLNTHAIGTRANRETLDIYESVWAAANTNGKALRWRVEHAQHIHPDDVPRFGALGVIGAVQGIHCTSDGPWIASRLGEERAEQTSYRWRDLLDSGAILNNGTDVPVEPIDPIASFYASVSRMMNTGEKFHPRQAMTRMEALKSYTLDNAYSAFEEDLKGSITPGKLADIVVLSQDIMTIEEDAIPATRIDYTFVGGELKYARGGG